VNQSKMIPETRPGEPAQYIVEAPDSAERRRLLAVWLERERAAGATTHLLSCDFGFAGPWAGLADLLRAIVPEAEREVPGLVERHADELTLVLPSLRQTLSSLNPTLTDTASPGEKVRNYPMDRAYRIVQGLIDFLSAWSAHRQAAPWVIACDRFEDAGALVKLFFRELARRRGKELGLTLICAVTPGAADGVELAEGCPTTVLRWALPAEPELPADPRRMSKLARELEATCENDGWKLNENIPRLIYYWQRSETPEKALVWMGMAFGEYNHFGFYEDALRYGNEIVAHLDAIIASTEEFTRWNLVGSMVNCYLALNRPEEALDIIEREGLAKVDDGGDRSRIFYILALIHSRFLPKPDFQKAEGYIDRGLAELKTAAIPEHEKTFLEVFLNNGLAFIRHRQGRPQEAIDLCQQGYEMLEEKLLHDHHRLHRSVLLYNMAQVYAALQEREKAVEYYSAAMKYDPNYSEYFNERGNTYLSLGRPDLAIADYREAIQLSAPYQEVWTNLGQAYRATGSLPEAVEAYSRALDLEPYQMLPRLGRAQAYDALGRSREALSDYTDALDREPAQPLALANRATLWYELGELGKAVEDLDRAVALQPDNPELLFNRAVALADLARSAEAVRDLHAVLALGVEGEERADIEARIAGLTGAEPAPPTALESASPA